MMSTDAFTPPPGWEPRKPVPLPEGYRPLTVGSISAEENSTAGDVRVWQEKMRERGEEISVDGSFGEESERCARTLQEEAGLAVDGVVGPETWIAAWGVNPRLEREGVKE
jgi:peptidoglycan hydrolase-like protein with peptidoglycan-binding domain